MPATTPSTANSPPRCWKRSSDVAGNKSRLWGRPGKSGKPRKPQVRLSSSFPRFPSHPAGGGGMTTAPHTDFEGVDFLFQNVLEAGIFAFITGSPGSTKTLVALDIAARLTRGKLPGDVTGAQANVVYVSVEGSFKRSIGPRFEAAGGDFRRFKHLEEVIWMPSNIARLERVIHQHKARLVIV